MTEAFIIAAAIVFAGLAVAHSISKGFTIMSINTSRLAAAVAAIASAQAGLAREVTETAQAFRDHLTNDGGLSQSTLDDLTTRLEASAEALTASSAELDGLQTEIGGGELTDTTAADLGANPDAGPADDSFGLPPTDTIPEPAPPATGTVDTALADAAPDVPSAGNSDPEAINGPDSPISNDLSTDAERESDLGDESSAGQPGSPFPG